MLASLHSIDGLREVLDITRCPRCLYDCRMQTPGERCPECGAVMPEGVTVLTIPRQPRGWREIASQVFWIGALTYFVAFDLRGSIGAVSFILVLLMQRVVQEAIRYYRIWSSRDAYTAQLWLSAAGMRYVADADPDAMGRSVETAASWVTSLLLLAALWFQQRSQRFTVFWTGGIVILAIVLPTLSRWWRRRKKSASPEPPEPSMTRWADLKPVEITTRKHRVSFKVETDRGNVSTWRFSIAGDEAVAAALATLVARFAGSRHVVMK